MRKINAIMKILVYFIIVNVFLSSCALQKQQKRYVYIIGGAHEGERIHKFKKQGIYSSHPWEIFAIEANPYVIDKIPKAPDTMVLNKAIWIKDGKIEFYLCPTFDSLSSVHKKSYVGKGAIPISVESIDFGKWLRSNFTINDYILVSFDIEGAEYEVLNKMVMDNTIQYIDSLLVEFHPGIGGISTHSIKELLMRIKKSGISVKRTEM